MNNEYVVETEQWKLGCFLDWREKHTYVKCPDCAGTGTVGGGFKDIDGERDCSSCRGSGKSYQRPTTTPPEIPPALREHMRRAWWDFLNQSLRRLGDTKSAWSEGYKAGVDDERTSEANIGIAGFGAKIEPARENPYGNGKTAAVPEPLTMPQAGMFLTPSEHASELGYVMGWNACRAAMLATEKTANGEMRT